MSGRLALASLAFVPILWAVPSATRAASLAAVAVQADPSPLTGFDYRRFGDPQVSDAAGQRVAFTADVRVPGRRCLFKVEPGAGGTTVGCVGDPTPDARQYRRFLPPDVNSSSGVAFNALVSSSREGVYRGDPSIVALLGDPFTGEGLLETFASTRINDDAAVVFRAGIVFGDTVGGVVRDQGLFRCSGGDGNCSFFSGGTGTLDTLVLKQDAVPDRADREFCSFGDVDASNFGIVFRAVTKLDCANDGEDPVEGVFRLPFGGTIETLALVGELGDPFGTVYFFFKGAPAIANNGTVAFHATTFGTVSEETLYLCVPGVCPAAPAEAAVAQGTLDPVGNVFGSFSPPGVSDAGDIAFTAKAIGVHVVRGVYIRRAGGTIETVALQGSGAPGILGTFRGFGAPAMSNGGKVAFRATSKAVTPPSKRESVVIFE